MNPFPDRLADVRRRIAAACARAGRAADSVRLIAVSKGVDAERLAAAITAGQCVFGESYLQEALAKMPRVADVAGKDVEWHFIGPVQSNKTAAIAANFAWIHGIGREKIARRLSDSRTPDAAPLNVCVQVNVSGEASKSGCAPDEAAALCAAVATLPRLCLRGLMAIPALDADAARGAFRALRELAGTIRAGGAVNATDFDTLSMGMSDDFEIAIEEGATLIRVGSSLFGRRS